MERVSVFGDVTNFRGNESSKQFRRNSSNGSMSRNSSGNGMSVGSWSETSVRYSQFGEEDADSRDSGIYMDNVGMSPDEMDFSLVRKHSYSRKVSEATYLPELVEEMEEVALNDSLRDLTDGEKETEQQLRRLSEQARSSRTTTPRKALADLKNTAPTITESPKTHIVIKRCNNFTKLQHSTSADDAGSMQRYSSFCETKYRRKRFRRPELLVVKRRRQVSETSTNENNEHYESGSTSISLMRVQSTSYIESGKCARDKLPDLLHVEYSLRTISKPQIDSVAFKSIDGSTLVELMDSMEMSEFEKKFIIVDCRYPYEYNGGHIRGAINLHDPSNLQSVFYPNSITKFQEMLRRIPIFYCEYSQERGPSMASALRQYDRCRNESRYPEVDYKEIYVLDCGYRKFFRQDGFVRFCEPPTYVPMREPSYRDELKLYRFHKTKSFSGLSSSFRMSNPIIDSKNAPRRMRLAFRSVSEDTTTTTTTSMTSLRSLLKSNTGSNLSPRCPDLFGSPFPCSSNSSTPPKSNATPIQMPHFS